MRLTPADSKLRDNCAVLVKPAAKPQVCSHGRIGRSVAPKRSRCTLLSQMVRYSGEGRRPGRWSNKMRQLPSGASMTRVSCSASSARATHRAVVISACSAMSGWWPAMVGDMRVSASAKRSASASKPALSVSASRVCGLEQACWSRRQISRAKPSMAAASSTQSAAK